MTKTSDPYENYDNGPNYPNGFEKRETTGGRTTPAIQEAIKHGADINDHMLTLKQPFHPLDKIGGPGCCNPGQDKWVPPTKEQIAKAVEESREIAKKEDRKHRTPFYPPSFLEGPQYFINKGWKVKGVFKDGEEMHGLVYNPYISCWFHMWWDKTGRCLTGNCQDGLWDLYGPSPMPC
jgi:hypothetical protein